VLAGGVGSRFWPLSTPTRPKQLLPLATDKPLLQDSVERLTPIVALKRILVLTNAGLAQGVEALLPDLPPDNIMVEPQPAGTAAALAWAALEIARRDGEDATMICVHADWSIGDDDEFRATLLKAEEVALETKSLVTVGVVPSRPDPGFGYIQPSPALAGAPSAVKRFVEKPDRAKAKDMVAAGYLWNSGIFVWRVADFLSEVELHTGELARALETTSISDASTFFAAVRAPISVDVGVLERSKKVMVVPGEFGWDDVGTWSALGRIRPKDEQGNVTSGDIFLLDGRDNVVYAEAGSVVIYGVDNLVVVVRDGMVLVTTTEKAADMKKLVDSLPQEMGES
jgi:mannose-1-phosphate guanylyltransferase